MTDLSKLKVAKEFGHSAVLMGLARMPGSQRLLVGASDFKVYDIDLAAEKPELKAFEAAAPGAGHTSYVTNVVVAGGKAISGGWDGRLVWWDLATRQPIRAVDAHAKWIRQLAVSPDGVWIASVADDMVARRWEVETGNPLGEFKGHELLTPHHYPSMLYACAISPDGQFLATGDKTGHVVIWDIAGNKQAAAVETPVMYTWDPKQRRHSIGGIRSLAFSPDGNQLAVGGMGTVGNIDHLEGKARVEVFDWRKAERTHEFPGTEIKGLVQSLRFHPQGTWLLGAGGDNGGFLMFYDLAANKVIKEEKAPMHIHCAHLNEAGDAIYAAGHQKLVAWELKG